MTIPVANFSPHPVARRGRWARPRHTDPAMPTLLGWVPLPPGHAPAEPTPRRRHLRLVHSR